MVLRIILIVFALAVGVMPAAAADAVYPPGSRIGLAPPQGMVTSKNFFGYEDAENNAAIIVLALPPQAYACLLYTSPSPRDTERSRMPSSA